jgi:hypothetical protein
MMSIGSRVRPTGLSAADPSLEKQRPQKIQFA